MRTAEEWAAYQQGRADADKEQKRCPGSFVVVFEDHLSPDERIATAALMRSVRGVVAVLPVEETHSGHLEWRELVEALDGDASDEHAHDAAMNLARAAHSELSNAAKVWDAFWKMATPAQQQTILREVYPHFGRTSETT